MNLHRELKMYMCLTQCIEGRYFSRYESLA